MTPSEPDTVIDFGEAKIRRRLKAARAKLQSVTTSNKRALSRLFQSGTLFTRQGARTGRALLASHQRLLKLNDRLLRLMEEEEVATPEEARTFFDHIDAVVTSARELSAKSDGVVTSLSRD